MPRPAPEGRPEPSRPLWPWLLPTALAVAVSLLLRHQLVEPAGWIAHCQSADGDPVCMLRSATITVFQQQRIGWVAAILGVIALLSRRRWVAGSALAVGSAGAVLYAVEPGVFGALLGLLALAGGRPSQANADTPMTSASSDRPSA